jgi:hypothetical protein
MAKGGTRIYSSPGCLRSGPTLVDVGAYVFISESQLDAGQQKATELGPDALAEWQALVAAFRQADARVQAARRAEKARMEAVGMLWPSNASWVYGAPTLEQGHHSSAEWQAGKREKRERDAAYNVLHKAEIAATRNIRQWLRRHVR